MSIIHMCMYCTTPTIVDEANQTTPQEAILAAKASDSLLSIQLDVHVGNTAWQGLKFREPFVNSRFLLVSDLEGEEEKNRMTAYSQLHFTGHSFMHRKGTCTL